MLHQTSSYQRYDWGRGVEINGVRCRCGWAREYPYQPESDDAGVLLDRMSAASREHMALNNPAEWQAYVAAEAARHAGEGDTPRGGDAYETWAR
jgi:hypothetical protein